MRRTAILIPKNDKISFTINGVLSEKTSMEIVEKKCNFPIEYSDERIIKHTMEFETKNHIITIITKAKDKK